MKVSIKGFEDRKMAIAHESVKRRATDEMWKYRSTKFQMLRPYDNKDFFIVRFLISTEL